jgi:hypothetical protein
MPPASPCHSCQALRRHLLAATLGAVLTLASLFVLAGRAHACEGDVCPAEAGSMVVRAYLPALGRTTNAFACPAASAARFDLIPVASGPTDRPAALHADLNLALRGYATNSLYRGLVEYNGDTDWDAPQLAAVVPGMVVPGIAGVYQVYNWNWESNARAGRITIPEVTLVALPTQPGAPLSIPSRQAELYGGGYRALVLYAEPQRLTLKYTREDNVIWGYTVHLEGLCVDPALLTAYRHADQQGRGWLPGLLNQQQVGVAAGQQVLVAVRDTGAFMDPRSRKDWWRTLPAQDALRLLIVHEPPSVRLAR